MLKRVFLFIVLILISVSVSADIELLQRPSGGWASKTDDPSIDAMIEMYQPYVQNLSYYHPMYFLAGTDPEKSKFQISFRYRFFNPRKELAVNHPWVKGFHLGYTQTSFWDLASDSAPFEDTSYKPELFFITPRIKTGVLDIKGLYIKTGLRHESNGQGGDLSCSTNTAYIESSLIYYNRKSQIGARITPRIWAYFYNEDENNPDIGDYRGYCSMGITIGKSGKLALDSNFRWAAKGPSAQVDLTYPLHTIFFNYLDLYLQVQYVNMLAESLLNYTGRNQALRIGFAFVR
jgi:outer membrane phospholipase A